MLLPDDVSELRRMASSGAVLPESLPAPSLGAGLELACTAWAWRGEADLHAQFMRWAASSPILEAAWGALQGLRPMGSEYSAIPREVRSVTDTTAQALFANRFRNALEQLGGFSKPFATSLAGGLEEMVDNVFQHSAASSLAAAPAVMAFEVDRHRFSFAVGDVGRGVLESLRDNPHWASLRNDAEALDAVAVHRASRRLSDPGSGFLQVVRALGDLGSFRFRSGAAYVTVGASSSAHTRTTARGASFPLGGVQLVVTSSP